MKDKWSSNDIYQPIWIDLQYWRINEVKKNNVDNNENIEVVEQILWKKLKLVGREIVIEQQLQINGWWTDDYE